MERFQRGARDIKALLEAGWSIVEDPRNHLTNDYGNGATQPEHLDGKPEREGVGVAPAIDVPAPRRGRPPGSKNKKNLL